MKKYYLFALVSAMTLIFACSTDSKRSMLIGKWDYESWNLNGDVTTANELEAPAMEFMEDGSYVLMAGVAVKEAKWDLNGDTVIVTDEGPAHKMVIKELSKEKLVLESTAGDLKTIITLKPSTTEGLGLKSDEVKKKFEEANKHLMDKEGHEHDHEHADGESHEGHDHN